MKTRLKYLSLLIYYLIYAFIYAGWLSHRSLNPLVLNYSGKYFLFLAIMAFPFFLPFFVYVYVKAIGWKGFFHSLAVISILMFIVYFVSAQFYYYTQKHLFDPFLQVPFNKIDDETIVKKENTFRILCLGGSSTECVNLPLEKRYPSILQSILQRRYPSFHIEVLNGGRNWYTSRHSLISYVSYYDEWNPDLVVVMQGVNDLIRSFSPTDFAVGEYNDQWTHFYGPSIQGARPPPFERHLLSYFETPGNAWYSKFRFKEVDYPLERYVSLAAFEKNLRKIVKYARKNGSEIVLVTQPSLYEKMMNGDMQEIPSIGKVACASRRNFIQNEYPSFMSLRRAMAAFNEATKDVAASEGALYVDGAGILGEDTRNFVDDVHYTEKGAKRVAEVIAETIIKSNLIEERK